MDGNLITLIALIIALVALRAGMLDVVKASITGSIIGNLLLVMGAAFLAGGLRHPVQTFATLVPTVDFAAATTQKGGSTVFTNPAYEKKGAVWKACFRAGKAPSQAALAFAQAWLKEL